jgi:pyruvate,water dikinase
MGAEGGAEFLAAFNAYLDEFGRGLQSWCDLQVPTWAERPSEPLSLIARYLSDPETLAEEGHARAGKRREQAIAEAEAELAGSPDLARFRSLSGATAPVISRARRLIRRRINLLHEVGWTCRRGDDRQRKRHRCLGVRWPRPLRSAGRLGNVKTAADRSAGQAQPRPRWPAGAAGDDGGGGPRRSGCWLPSVDVTPAGTVTASPPARSTDGAGRPLRPRRRRPPIVATYSFQFTTPAWTPLFSLAAAVVTNAGGVLSHAAIEAREYGIVAVVGTRDGTRRIPDGAMVTVDGSTGIVTIHG